MPADADEPNSKHPDKPGEEAAKDVGKRVSLEEELNASSDRIRETAKWLVATFGTIAGALIVGLQLSDIGKLEGTDRVIATIAAFGALAAVILIVALATVVLARGRVPLSELSSKGKDRRFKRLREALERNRSIYGSYGSVPELVDKVESEWDQQLKSWNEMKYATDDEARHEAKTAFDATKKRMPELNNLTHRLMAYARAEDIRLTFESVRNAIVALALVVAIGAAVFASVDNAPDEAEAPALSQRPVAAQLHLDASGKEKLGTILGDGCRLERVQVEVLSSSEDGWDAVSIPSEGCDAARLTIEPDDGELEALESVSLEAPDDDEDLDPPPAG